MVVICILALIFSFTDLGLLIFVALLTYQGIIMIFPTLMFGLFWKRANKEGAIAGLVAGTTVSMGLSLINPSFIQTWGWSAGIYGLAVSVLITWLFGYIKEPSQRAEKLWQDIATARQQAVQAKIDLG